MSHEFGVWETTAPPAPNSRALRGAVETDTVIVGAGFTGLSTALHLAERGHDCLVIEAREPGWGASGRNTGWFEPNWWTQRPGQINARFGVKAGTALSRWVASGPALLNTWEAQYGWALEREQRGLVLASTDRAKARTLEDEARDWQAMGVRNEYLDTAQIEARTGLAKYAGALLLTEGCTLNPLALARELAKTVIGKSVPVHSHSRAHAIERIGASWRVTTPDGEVRSRRLVLATDAYTRDLWPELSQSFSTWHAAIIASAPYPHTDSLLPRGLAFADLALGNIFTLRTARGGRLVTSTFAPVRRSLSASSVARPFMRRFARTFPALPAPRWEYTHRGEIGLSADMMPRLCSIGHDAWTAYGYSGTGINFALLLGGELAALAAGTPRAAPAFPLQSLAPVKGRGAINLGLRYVHAPLARHVISRFA